MLTLIEKILFALLAAGLLYLAYVHFNRMRLVIWRGQGKFDFANAPARLRRALDVLFTQRTVLKTRFVTSLFHAFIAWGFIFYLLVNFGDLLEGYFPLQFLGGGLLGDVYRLLADLLSVAVLVGMVYFLIRRFLTKAPALTFHDNVKLHPKVLDGLRRDSLIVGGFILFHVGFRFLGASLAIAREGPDPWQPFAGIVAGLWAGLGENSLVVAEHGAWWIALGLILGFLPYFPYSKHIHLIMGPLNYFVRPERSSPGALDPVDFEDETIEQFGATNLEDLPIKLLLDPFACIMCNRCQDVCPAYVTGKELSPSALEINKRYFIKDHMAALAGGEASPAPLLDFAISRSAVWACTTCGACAEVCPVGNEPFFDIMEIRREQVLMTSEFPGELQNAFRGMERNSNPWQMAPDRLAWTQGLEFKVPTVEENPDFEVLYWVGCAGAFDPNAQETARAFARVLQAAGVNFAILGNMEACTGDSARRAGNEYLFFEMAQANIATLNEVGAKKIVTTCPHCLHTLGREYPQFSGHFTVLHHTQFIAELIGQNRLTLKNGSLEQTTFHDPCYLGRHNGVYEAPREVLAQAGKKLLEMDRSRRNSFCCGAGGAQIWKEEEHGQQAVSQNRYREAQATGAGTLAVGCPFCKIMLNDANKEAGEKMQVKDLAEVVAASL